MAVAHHGGGQRWEISLVGPDIDEYIADPDWDFHQREYLRLVALPGCGCSGEACQQINQKL
jgi:hypothetical protein